MKIIKKILLVLVLIFVGMQFYRPDKNIMENDTKIAFFTDTNPPSDVKAILESSCYDCHSNNTKYPWYNNIAPVSYWMADHIRHGKGHLNFSEWEKYSLKKRDHKLEEVIEMVEDGTMPLNEYTWTHEEANLTQEQRTAIVEWARRTRAIYQLGQQPE